MNAAQKLSSYMEALRPIIYINHFDFNSVDELIRNSAENTPIVEFNNALGRVDFQTKIGDNLHSPDLGLFLDDYNSDMPLNRILVLKDIHHQLSEPAICAKLKAIAERTMYQEQYWVPVIIVSSQLCIPTELEKLITVFDIPYPEVFEIAELIRQYARSFSFSIADAEVDELALAFKGLSRFEITQILNLAYQRTGVVSVVQKELILKEKEQAIKKTGMLEIVAASDNMDSIGGLDKLVSYLRRKSKVYRDVSAATKFGVDIPKGILIVGMPGCGKSLTAKASAMLFNAPLLRLDVGKLLGKYVGESEENLRQAIRIAEAASPCILWIDEIEKAFAGIGDNSGGGVTTRLFGYFLTWLQEKDSTVYVVATSNDITTLPPEFLRKGRFDEIFFVDLPNKAERKKIFEIHLAKRKKDFRKLGISTIKLARLTAGEGNCNNYSGADIEAIVKNAVEKAFFEQRDLTQTDLEEAIIKTTPIAKALETKIKTLNERLKVYDITPASSQDEPANENRKYNFA